MIFDNISTPATFIKGEEINISFYVLLRILMNSSFQGNDKKEIHIKYISRCSLLVIPIDLDPNFTFKVHQKL